MFPDHNAAIADILKQSGKLSAEQVGSMVAEQERSGKSLAETAIDSGSIASGDLLKEVSSYLDWPYQPVLPASISEKLKGLVEDRLARMYGVLPCQEAGYELKLLAVDPFNTQWLKIYPLH